MCPGVPRRRAGGPSRGPKSRPWRMLVDRLLEPRLGLIAALAVRSLTFFRASSSAGRRAFSFSQHQMAFWKSSANSSKWAAERRNRSSFSPWGMTASIRYWASFLRPRFSAASAPLWKRRGPRDCGRRPPRRGRAPRATSASVLVPGDLDPEPLELEPDHAADLRRVVAELATLDPPERLAIGQVVGGQLARFLVHLGGVDVVALSERRRCRIRRRPSPYQQCSDPTGEDIVTIPSEPRSEAKGGCAPGRGEGNSNPLDATSISQVTPLNLIRT